MSRAESEKDAPTPCGSCGSIDLDRIEHWLECRPFLAGRALVEVRTTEPDVVTRIDELFADMPGAAPDTDPPVRLDVRIAGEQREDPARESSFRWLETWVDGTMQVGSRQLFRHEDAVGTSIDRALLDAGSGRLHLHAALVAREGRGVLVVGEREAGKTTLAAALVRAGWTYLTDETVAFDLALPQLAHGYPRPLRLRRGAWQFFRDLTQFAGVAQVRSGRLAWQTPSHVLHPDGHRGETGPVAVDLVVLPNRQGEPGWAPVPFGELLEALVSSSLDLERSGDAGMELLARLAASTPSLALTADVPDRLDAQIRAVAAAATTAEQAEEAELRVLRQMPSASGGHSRRPGGITPTDSAVCFRVNGEGAVYDQRSGTLIRLNPQGLDLWERLLDAPTLDDLVTEAVDGTAADPSMVRAGLAAFVDTLTDQGVLVDTRGTQSP